MSAYLPLQANIVGGLHRVGSFGSWVRLPPAFDKANRLFPQQKAAAASNSTRGGKTDKLELRVFFLIFFFCGQNGDPSTPVHLYIMDYQKYTAVRGGESPGAFCLAELGKEGLQHGYGSPRQEFVGFPAPPPLCVCVLDARRIKKKKTLISIAC